MNHPSRRLPLLVLLLSAWAVVSAGCANNWPPEPQAVPQLGQVGHRSWSYRNAAGEEISTAHYQVFTTHTDQGFLEQLPLFLETAFAHYQSLIRPTRQPDKPMEVYLFGKREQWEQFTTDTTGPAAAIYRKIQEGGYADNGRAVFYDIDRRKTFAVTGHECFHQYVWHFTKHRPPAWMDEGLACYFETFTWEGTTLKFEPARNQIRLDSLRRGLTDKTTLDLSELLSTHAGNVIGSSSGKVASYYAQLWALMLFMMEDQAYKAKFTRLLADVGSHRMVEQASSAGYSGQGPDFGPAVFKAYITSDLPAFNAKFQAYCMNLAFPK